MYDDKQTKKEVDLLERFMAGKNVNVPRAKVKETTRQPVSKTEEESDKVIERALEHSKEQSVQLEE